MRRIPTLWKAALFGAVFWFVLGAALGQVATSGEETALSFDTNGQSAEVNVSGVSTLGSSQVYTGKYVALATDHGFLWLDTETLTAGFVQAIGVCGLPLPPPSTGLYTIGDCSGISSIGATSSFIVANNFNGQCSIVTQGCGGGRQGFSALAFELGTWRYEPAFTSPISGSPQGSDPQGRRWSVSVLGPSWYLWTVAGSGPTPGPAEQAPTPWLIVPTQTPPPVSPTRSTLLIGPRCGPTSSGQCYDCLTFQFLPCPELTTVTAAATPSPPATAVSPSATPSPVPPSATAVAPTTAPSPLEVSPISSSPTPPRPASTPTAPSSGGSWKIFAVIGLVIAGILFAIFRKGKS